MGASGGNTVSADKDGRKGWFQRSLEFWSPFWIMVAGICAVVVVLLTVVLVAETSKPSTASEHPPSPTSPNPPSPTSPNPAPSPTSASQIANDVTGNTVNDS